MPGVLASPRPSQGREVARRDEAGIWALLAGFTSDFRRMGPFAAELARPSHKRITPGANAGPAGDLGYPPAVVRFRSIAGRAYARARRRVSSALAGNCSSSR